MQWWILFCAFVCIASGVVYENIMVHATPYLSSSFEESNYTNTYTTQFRSGLQVTDIMPTYGDITGVSSNGSHTAGTSWNVRDPQIHNGLIVFDTHTNDTTNRLRIDAGESVTVQIRWHDADNRNADLNLYVSNGTYYHISREDQWNDNTSTSAESVTFMSSNNNDTNWDISIGIIGTAVPNWIELFVGGNHSTLEYDIGRDAIHGVIYEGISDYTPVEVIITTHNPACTAVFLNYINVTRLTDVRPHWPYGGGYSNDGYKYGINITTIVWPYEANSTIAAIVERPEVISVAAYPYIMQNTTLTKSSQLLSQSVNPNAKFSPGVPDCYPVHQIMIGLIMDKMEWWEGAGPDAEPATSWVGVASSPTVEYDKNPVDLTLDPTPWSDRHLESGIYWYGDLMAISIVTHDVNATWVYMKENSVLVASVVGHNDTRDTVGIVGGYVPLSFIWPLWDREEVVNIRVSGPPIPLQ